MANNLDWKGIAKKTGFNSDKAMFKYYYEEQNMGSQLVARIIKVGRATVLHRAKKLGIKIKPRGGRNNLHPETDIFEESILIYDKAKLLTMTSKDIMKNFDIPKSVFYKIVKKHDIKYWKHGRNRKQLP